LEYIANPTEVIEELNKIPIKFRFEDERYEDLPTTKRRLLCASSDFSGADQVFDYNEREMFQSQLLDRLELSNGIEISDTENAAEPCLGIYTQEERVERLNKFREKRKQRVFGKVRYALRKRASQNRTRVNGRFTREIDPDVQQKASQNLKDFEKTGVDESTSWIESISLKTRRLSDALRRHSLPSRPPSPEKEQNQDARQNSWSSWLLMNRRKSSASSANGQNPSATESFEGDVHEPYRKRTAQLPPIIRALKE
jgi:hypothetical protein